MVGPFHVQDPGVDQPPERREMGRRRIAAHLLVRCRVEVRAAEPAITEERVDVAMTGHQPMIGRRVVDDRRRGPELLVHGIRIGDERDVLRGEAHPGRVPTIGRGHPHPEGLR